MTSRENITTGQIAYLYSEIASIISGGGGGVPTSSGLADVLINGNSAGSNGIDMNQQDITNGINVNVGSNGHSITIDGASSTLTLTDNLGNINVITASGTSVPNTDADNVLTTATTTNSTFYPTFLGATTGYNACGVDTGLTYNPSTHTETFSDGTNSTIIDPTSITTGTLNYTTLNPPITAPTNTLTDVLIAGNNAGSNDIDMNSNDILLVNNIDLVTINGSAYPPVVSADTLSAVLTAGNTATNSIILNNGATNVITTNPSLNTIVITDGTTTNTIDQSGYTTKNSVQNSTHFLNFSDSSSTGVGAVQKTAGIECNPSTKTITATTFVGNLTGNATSATTASGATDITITDSTTTVGTFFPTFVNSAGTNKTVRIDTTGLTYVPSTDTLTATNFNGTATHATDITITDTISTAGTYYPTFVNTAGTQKSVRVDTTGLTYTPSTDTLTTTNFAGTATRASNIAGGLSYGIPYQVGPNSTGFIVIGTAGQVLQSNGSSTTPSWVTPSTSATTIAITNTNAPTAGTFYPTFVSASGSGQTLRADITGGVGGLQYTPSSNSLQITDGTETVSISPSSISGALTMSSNDITAFTTLQIAGVGTFATTGISFSQIVSFGSATGVKENSVLTTPGFTLTTADAFKTIISAGASVRTYVLPAPTVGTVGYWYSFCNKNATGANTMLIQQPAGTTLFSIAGGNSAVGTTARFAVTTGGATYFLVSN